NVEDQSTGSFSVSAGLSTSDGFIAQVALEETNFLGRGQTVRVSVGGGQNSRDYNLSFTDPYFLGTHVSAGFDLYDSTTTQNTSAQPYNTEAIGGGLRLGLPLTDDLGLQFNYKIVNNTISGASAPGSDFFPNGSRLTSSLGYALTYSTIDNTQDPHEGWYFKLAQDFAGVGGDAKYVRTTGDARVYAPVIPDSDIIGMLKVTGGNITGLGQSVVDSDNFFKGGETIRGFAPFGIGPRYDDGTNNIALGGKNFVAGTAEVDFPLPLIPPDFGLKGAVFADAGMLWGNDGVGGAPTYNDTALRTSVGGSIIWASPFGQIRADFAQALSKQSYDQTQFFRIGAGTSF
ncbi:MAG TPA: BamA/TamA family outer membrane protein, partial [Bauldia sp.]|nr:BamA/TamA family outer membrane protein [Bauldia sp.]